MSQISFIQKIRNEESPIFQKLSVIGGLVIYFRTSFFAGGFAGEALEP
jgi:hypothetical protein